MKITITGSLGNISRPLAELLIKAGHQVTIISSNPANESAIKSLGATAAIGSIADEAFLVKAFTGADAVYTMIPPNFAAPDYRAYMNEVGRNYVAAIKKANVSKVVNLSSIGAHLEFGTGPITGLYDTEKMLNALENVAVVHLRAGFFYINFFNNIGMIKHAGILGSNYPASAPLAMVHPVDIAKAAAEEFQHSFTGKSVRYVISDDAHTNGEVAAILGAAIGKPDLPWVEFTDQQALEGMLQAGLPQEISSKYVEMGTAVRNGILWEDYNKHKQPLKGTIKLETFAEEFAAKFNGE